MLAVVVLGFLDFALILALIVAIKSRWLGRNQTLQRALGSNGNFGLALIGW